MQKKSIKEIKEYISNTKITCSYKFIVIYIFLRNFGSKLMISEEQLEHYFELFFKLRQNKNLLVEVQGKCNPFPNSGISKVLKTPIEILLREGIIKSNDEKEQRYYSNNFDFDEDGQEILREKILNYFIDNCGDSKEEIEEIVKEFDELLNRELLNAEEKNSIPKSSDLIFTKKRILSEKIVYDKAEVEELEKLLLEYKQIIFYGPPGTGKTFLAQILAQKIAGEKYEIIQFHPSYSYEDFVEGIDVILSENNKTLAYEAKPRIFRTFCNYAISHPEENIVLIIDEINRGDLSRIFGELILGLESNYRGKVQISTSLSRYLGTLVIPPNLLIIGTMNSLDRSIAIVDYALRRRFLFYPLKPDGEKLRKWHLKNNLDQNNQKESLKKLISLELINQDMSFSSVILGLFEKINYKILKHRNLGENFQIGHTYFYVKDYSQFSVRWRYKIYPVLEEYLDFDKNELSKFKLSTIIGELYGKQT